MIRPTVPSDTAELLALTDATGVFKPHEIQALAEVLDDYFTQCEALGHRSYTWDDGQIRGFVYVAPASMADRTWYLWWIAVSSEIQGRGIGRTLLMHAESVVRAACGRLLLIETSGTNGYDKARRLYETHGYAVVARIPDFYADGDDLVVFGKRLRAVGSQVSSG